MDVNGRLIDIRDRVVICHPCNNFGFPPSIEHPQGTFGVEGGGFSGMMSRYLPGMEGISRVHDVIMYLLAPNGNQVINIGTMVPAAVVTYGGSIPEYGTFQFVLERDDERRKKLR